MIALTDGISHADPIDEPENISGAEIVIPEPDVASESPGHGIALKPLLLLSTLHFSSTWGDRCFEFAAPIFLIEIFLNSLLPISLFGFFTSGIAIMVLSYMLSTSKPGILTTLQFSTTMGGLVDKNHRLYILQIGIFVQKMATAVAYSLFCIVFFEPSLLEAGSHGSKARGPIWALLSVIIICGMIVKLWTVCIQITIERDWAVTIGHGSTRRLTKVNTWLRRIDLICKLVSPLFVSALTAGVSYRFAAVFLCGMAVITSGIEIPLARVVYNRFPILDEDRLQRQADAPVPAPRTTRMWIDPRQSIKDWKEFSKLPVFYTSLSIASIYLTVLSFDGTFITYLKSARNWNDPFIAGMRALSTLTGLLGTVIFPYAQRKIGVARAGVWSIWSEIASLVTTVVALYVGAPSQPSHGPAYNSAMLFGGIAASRIGLWMFDLAQLQILQEALADHPRRNTFTALQYSLMNTFDMLKYVLTIALSDPQQFRWSGLVSWAVILVGGILFSIYVRKSRGHLVHLDWMYRLLEKKDA